MNQIIQVGLWEVNDYGLTAKVSPNGLNDYSIEKGELWKKRTYNDKILWDWLIHLTEKDYVTLSTVNDLNIAFFFAQDYYKSEKPDKVEYISTAQTIYVQRQMLEIKEKFNDPTEYNKPIALSESVKTERFKEYKKAKGEIKVLDID